MAKAYVNKRDKFLWDNSFKPEMSIPVPEVSDVGKAVVVDADGDYTLGDVSTEDEIVYVHFVETTSVLVDYTFAEVKALLDAGKHVVLIRDNSNVRAYYELYSYYNNEAIFTNQRTLEYLSENTLFAYNVVINFTNETLVQYTSRYVLDHKIYDTAVAYEHNTVRNYTVGEYCVHEGRLYRCTNDTTGPFAVEDWSMTHVMREIPRIQYNYSTTEHVVGTWIDGKPLYEQIISSGLSWPAQSSASSNLSTSLNISDVKLVTYLEVLPIPLTGSSIQHIQHVQNGARNSAFEVTVGDIVTYSDRLDFLAITRNSNASWLGASDVLFLLRYTKTTD